MASKRTGSKPNQSKTPQSSAPEAKPTPTFLAPLKPRPKLAMALGILLVLWLLALLVMRLTTVHRTPPSSDHLMTAPAE
jgi:hypothetical protein